MDIKPKLYKQRELVTKMVLEILRLISTEVLKTPEGVLDFPDLILCMALLMAQAQGKPMSPAKAGQYVGIPRATAVRRIAGLQAMGVVEIDPDTNKVSVSIPLLNAYDSLKVTGKIQGLIHSTCLDLTRLDTGRVEKAVG